METSVAPVAATLSGDRLNEAAAQLRAAADARKCWSCGCFRHALETFDRAIPEPERPAILAEAMASATDRLLPKKYECLGCDVCYPAVALNALVALARNGVNDDRRIINAKGKRPELRNLELTAIDHFRKTVEVIDLIGNTDVKELSLRCVSALTAPPVPLSLLLQPLRSCLSPGGCRKRWCLIRQATLLFSLTECAVD